MQRNALLLVGILMVVAVHGVAAQGNVTTTTTTGTNGEPERCPGPFTTCQDPGAAGPGLDGSWTIAWAFGAGVVVLAIVAAILLWPRRKG